MYRGAKCLDAATGCTRRGIAEGITIKLCCGKNTTGKRTDEIPMNPEWLKEETRIWWRFKDDQEWKFNEILVVDGPMIRIGRTSSGPLSPPYEAWWVTEEQIDVRHWK